MTETDTFTEFRPLLFSIAYRMLGLVLSRRALAAMVPVITAWVTERA